MEGLLHRSQPVRLIRLVANSQISLIFTRDRIHAVARMCYRPSVRLSVCLSVRPSVRLSVTQVDQSNKKAVLSQR